MRTNQQDITRRKVLKAVLGLGGMVLRVPGLAAKTANQRSTPPMTRGPFYPQIKPLDQDADLTALSGSRQHAQGQTVHLTGRILDLDGKPVSGARVAIWQADAHGHYHHPNDRQPTAVDGNFQGFGVQTTDAQGRYRFKTIKPGAYPLMAGLRTPHIHFEIEGRNARVVTQMFFPDEALNANDGLLQALQPAQRELVMAKRMPAIAGMDPRATHLAWDIILMSG
ncbi:protocatechuate 3,4-dioxygenase beta subunit [Lysobacter niastensis]|uniref:Protocatechuate 3,4-dioxygenase beta subunit n=1 Tax=Lysobacter niastensis TaxID=380629 RepID=A0ABU1WCW2_9GAMM|nr:protocatechuate 3,4-dioxygenase [Lysobacter niastensis]MDR7135364.1 protocatechuate 3,4-dioxygenase beta subunit [Lysobacter niastensis]